MNEYLDSKIAAQRLGLSERDVCRKCREGIYPGACKIGGRWKIPLDADPKLAERKDPQDLLEPLQNIPAKKHDEAVRRLGILKDFEKFHGTLSLQEGQKKPDKKPQGQPTLRPVRTPLDGQVAEHQRQEILKEVKKAAGAESVEKVLDFDFSLLKPESKYERVRLLDDE